MTGRSDGGPAPAPPHDLPVVRVPAVGVLAVGVPATDVPAVDVPGMDVLAVGVQGMDRQAMDRQAMDMPTMDVPAMGVPGMDRPGGGGAGGADSGGLPRLAGFPWERAAALGAFVLADGSGAAEQLTAVRLAHDRRGLYVRFECADRDAWGTYLRRNDPIYREEAVEVFLAPGEAPPRRYWELEVSPLGVLFAARIENPTGRRADLVADTSWECSGLEWRAGPSGPGLGDMPDDHLASGTGRISTWPQGHAGCPPWTSGVDIRPGRPASQDWWAELAIPWTALAFPPPRRWRANFYRIERPRGGEPELSCWSPTLTDPPDFHRPERFGFLELQPDR